MPSLTAEGFIISLSLGQNDVRVVKGALCLLREHFIHRSRNADSAGDYLGNAAESRVLRVLNGRVVEHLAAAYHYRQLTACRARSRRSYPPTAAGFSRSRTDWRTLQRSANRCLTARRAPKAKGRFSRPRRSTRRSRCNCQREHRKMRSATDRQAG